MRVDEAVQYQDALDAVEAGTANTVQYAEAEAVLAGLFGYLTAVANKASSFRSAISAFKGSVSQERLTALSINIDGDVPLKPPRIGDASPIVASASIATP